MEPLLSSQAYTLCQLHFKETQRDLPATLEEATFQINELLPVLQADLLLIHQLSA